MCGCFIHKPWRAPTSKLLCSRRGQGHCSPGAASVSEAPSLSHLPVAAEVLQQRRLVWLLFGGGAMALLFMWRVPHTHALMDMMQQVQLRAAATLAASVLAAFATQPMAAAGLVIFMVLLAVLVVWAGDLRDIKAANRGDTSALQRRIAKLYSVRSELLMMAARQPAMLQGLQALADRAFTTRTRLSALL